MRFVLIFILLISSSGSAVAERVCLSQAGEGVGQGPLSHEPVHQPLDRGMQEDSSTILSLALSLSHRDEEAEPHILPCVLAENGTFGKICADAQTYLITEEGTQLCLFLTQMSSWTFEHHEWGPTSHTDDPGQLNSAPMAMYPTFTGFTKRGPGYVDHTSGYLFLECHTTPYYPSHWAPG